MSTLHIAYYIGGRFWQCWAIMQIEIPLDFVAGCKSSLWASWLLLMSILQSTYYIQGGRWCSMQVFIVGQLAARLGINLNHREGAAAVTS